MLVSKGEEEERGDSTESVCDVCFKFVTLTLGKNTLAKKKGFR